MYYTYIHIRESDGLVFYVGKGQRQRAWQRTGRSDWWHRAADKHGVEVIICGEFNSEVCAFTHEKILIAKFRALGHPLVNVTDGGEGSSGAISKCVIGVNCSNGMRFDSITSAVKWLASNGKPKAQASAISACCKGKANNAYGFAWWYDGDDAREYVNLRQERVCCSNGMVFESFVSAASWVESEGISESASPGFISECCKGKYNAAYGFSWWNEGEQEKPHMTRGMAQMVSVRCSNGMVFDSVSDAALWATGVKRKGTGRISEACRGVSKTAYGYEWSYV